MSSASSTAPSTASTVLRADLVAALDQLDELVDDRARLGDPRVVALQRQPVAAEPDRAVQALAQRPEHAVSDARQLGGDVVRDREDFLQRTKCRRHARRLAAARSRARASLFRHTPVADT